MLPWSDIAAAFAIATLLVLFVTITWEVIVWLHRDYQTRKMQSHRLQQWRKRS